LLAGQFVSDVDSGTTRGVQRRYTRMDALVYYGSPSDTDRTPPAIHRARAVTEPGLVGFRVDATDESDVVRALVLFKDASGAWSAVDLTGDGEGRWSGTASADLGVDDQPVLEWFVQVVDATGNVAASTNKGGLFPARALADALPGEEPGAPLPAPGPQAPSLQGALGQHGWFTGAVTIGGPDDQTATPSWVSEDGIHEVTVTRNGSSATYLVAVDATPPSATITSPGVAERVPTGATLRAGYGCSDATSGIVSCAARVHPPGGADPLGVRDGGALPTGQTGRYQLVVTASDRAGHVQEESRWYEVADEVPTPYRFDGFYAPIADAADNVLKAGQSAPVKFRLFDGETVVGDLAVVGVHLSALRTCGTAAETNPVTETVAPSAGSGLRWDLDDQQFVYIHRSDKRWEGCHTLTFTFAHPDGSQTTERVVFRYRK
jgi:hypothetical protein